MSGLQQRNKPEKPASPNKRKVKVVGKSTVNKPSFTEQIMLYLEVFGFVLMMILAGMFVFYLQHQAQN